MKVKLNVKNSYLARAIMVLDKYQEIINRLKNIDNKLYSNCGIEIIEGVNTVTQKYICVEDAEFILWNIIKDACVGENNIDLGDTEIFLENEDEINAFIKLPRYLEILDEMDNLCRDLRKGYINDEYYLPDNEDDPYISFTYLQSRINDILN